MEGVSESLISQETIDAELKRKIAVAKAHCLSLEEESEITGKLVEGTRLQTERELTDDEVEHYYAFRERLDQASIVVNTLYEARRAMELIGFDQDSLIDILSHENAHANKAMQVGANFGGYKFVLVKDMDGGLLIHPMAVISLPEDWNYEKRRELESQIIRAPDEYGNKMSEGDKEELRIKYGE